jgi:hypothetical protein
MYFKDMKELSNIYPLTIISRRYGGFCILNCNACAKCVSTLEEDENIVNDEDNFMKKNWSDIKYGIGDSIENAFYDFKKRNQYE